MINRVTLIGRLGQEPKSFSDGKVCKFSIATTEKTKDKEETTWHNVVCFNERLNKVIMQYYGKGDLVFVEGSIKTGSYTNKEGQVQKTFEIAVGFNGMIKKLQSEGKAGEPKENKAYILEPKESAAMFEDEIPF